MAGRIILETDRLVLREFDERDAAAVFVLGSDPEIIRHTGDPGGGMTSVADAVEVIRTRTLPDYRTRGYGRWACVEKQTGAVVGFAGLKYLEELGEVDLGYRFVPAYWGRGLATETGRAILRYGFDTLGLRRVIGQVMPANVASIRVLEKLGFRFAETIEDQGVLVAKYVIETRA